MDEDPCLHQLPTSSGNVLGDSLTAPRLPSKFNACSKLCNSLLQASVQLDQSDKPQKLGARTIVTYSEEEQWIYSELCRLSKTSHPNISNLH